MGTRTSTLVALVSLVGLSACAGAPESSSLAEAGMTYTDRGWTYTDVAKQDWKKAETRLAAEVDANPDDPFRLLNLAYIYTKTDRPADAVTVYERVLDLDTNPVATLNSGHDSRTKKIAKDALASLGATE